MLRMGKRKKEIQDAHGMDGHPAVPCLDYGLVIPGIWMIIGFLYDIWYQIYPGKWILDADLASEMVLADMLNKSGGILSEEWNYSSELRVFQSQWFYRIGLLIFPGNWHCARIVASALLLLAFAAAVLFFTHMAGMGRYGVWCSAILMWPFGRWYLVYGLYGTYYIIYMLFSLLVMGILLRMTKHRGAKNIPWGLAGAFLAFASGLNGVKQTMVFFVPLLAAVVMLLILSVRSRRPQTFREMVQVCSGEVRMAVLAGTLVCCNVAGYLVNAFVLSEKYSYKHFENMVWAWDLPNRLYDVWLDFFLLFGHQKDMKVVSFRGAVSVLGLLFGTAIAFSIVRLCRRYEKLAIEQKLVVLLTVGTLVTEGMVFCLIGEYKDYYWLPLFPFAIAVLLTEIRTEDFSLRHMREILLAGIVVSTTLCSQSTVKMEMEQPLFGQAGFNQVADYLVENGYTQGYALFWSSNVLREMSDGKIETWTIYSGEYDFIYEWLQEKEHSNTRPEAPYFLVINKNRGGGPECYVMLEKGGILVYEKDPFYIYIFDSDVTEGQDG